MERYDILDGGIRVVSYSDCSKIIGDFSENEQTFEGNTIGAFGYILI